MLRWLMVAAVAVATLAGCDEKKGAAGATPATTTVAPTPMPTTAVAPPASGAAASGVAVAPSGAAVAPSGETAKRKVGKSGKPGAPTPPPAATGAMPHGNPEDGTLHYNPPPAQNPPPTPPVKKGTTL